MALFRRFLFVQTLIVILGMQSFAYGRVVESHDWLTNGAREAVELAASSFSFYNLPLEAGEHLAMVKIDRGRVDYYLIGENADDKNKLGKSLDRWRADFQLPGNVQISTEKECTIALYSLSLKEFGASKSTKTFRIDTFFTVMMEEYPKANMLATAHHQMVLESEPKADFTPDTGNRFWNLNSKIPFEQPLKWNAQVTNNQIFGLILWLLWVPLAALITYMLCRRLLNHEHISIKEKHKKYKTILAVGAVIGTGCFIALTFSAIFSNYFDPLMTLWFGERFRIFGFIGLMISCLFSLFSHGALMDFEDKFHLNEPDLSKETLQEKQERLAYEADQLKQKDQLQAYAKVRKRIVLFSILGLLAMAAINFFYGKFSPFMDTLHILIVTPVILPLIYDLRAIYKERPVVIDEEIDLELLNEVRNIAANISNPTGIERQFQLYIKESNAKRVNNQKNSYQFHEPFLKKLSPNGKKYFIAKTINPPDIERLSNYVLAMLVTFIVCLTFARLGPMPLQLPILLIVSITYIIFAILLLRQLVRKEFLRSLQVTLEFLGSKELLESGIKEVHEIKFNNNYHSIMDIYFNQRDFQLKLLKTL